MLFYMKMMNCMHVCEWRKRSLSLSSCWRSLHFNFLTCGPFIMIGLPSFSQCGAPNEHASAGLSYSARNIAPFTLFITVFYLSISLNFWFRIPADENLHQAYLCVESAGVYNQCWTFYLIFPSTPFFLSVPAKKGDVYFPGYPVLAKTSY